MGVGDNDSGGQMEALLVPAEAAGKRVDLFISAHAPDNISRARVQALVRQGHVTINGVVPRGTSSKIAEGDVVRFVMPEAEEAIPQPEKIALDVLHEDSDLIVINKPAGMVVHPAPGNWSGTLVNALLYHCEGALSGIGGVKRPGIVHRLDKDTSGVIVVAKSYRAHIDLQEQFADHGKTGPLERSYWALTWGAPPRMKGTIDAALGRHPSDRLKRAVVDEHKPDAKHAVTHFELLERFADPKNDGEFLASLTECRLETGRTHQIRVHMAHINHPLMGDQVYGKHFATRKVRLPEAAQAAFDALGRQALHARTLGFRHPSSGETCSFTAEPPADIMKLVETLRAGSE